GEEEHLAQAPVEGRANGLAERPALLARFELRGMGALRMTRIEALPWHYERDDGHEQQQRAAEHAVGKAPVIVPDEILGKRDEDDGADAGGRKGDADRGREPFAEPA